MGARIDVDAAWTEGDPDAAGAPLSPYLAAPEPTENACKFRRLQETPLDVLSSPRLAHLDDPAVRAIETREFKRMWRATERNVDQASYRTELARDWCREELLARLEEVSRAGSATLTAAELRARLAQEVLDACAGYLDTERGALVRALLDDESVPFLSAAAFTPSGLEKHAAWQHTWSLQRREDAGEPVGTIPVPPKYDQKDFRSPTYWRLRGKLDVPKERFISYPGCESNDDGEPLYGWAGWNHQERAQALVALYQDRRNREGWPTERLTPMLAGLLELLPWLLQWHDEPDPENDMLRPGQEYQVFLDGECRRHGLTHEDLRGWRPRERKGEG